MTSNSEKEIKVLGVVTVPVEENQPPLVQTDKGALYASGNIILLQERDLPVLFKNSQLEINRNEDLVFVPDDVIKTWLGQK